MKNHNFGGEKKAQLKCLLSHSSVTDLGMVIKHIWVYFSSQCWCSSWTGSHLYRDRPTVVISRGPLYLPSPGLSCFLPALPLPLLSWLTWGKQILTRSPYCWSIPVMLLLGQHLLVPLIGKVRVWDAWRCPRVPSDRTEVWLCTMVASIKTYDFKFTFII